MPSLRSLSVARAALLAAFALLLAAAPLALAPPPPAAAFVVGVGDGDPALFENEWFARLHPRRVRYIASYDAALRPSSRGDLDTWIRAAAAHGSEVVIAFNPPPRMRCPNVGGARGCRPVSVARYRRAFAAFHRRYPTVRIFQPWNEVNSLTQPTARQPRAVVAYYRVVRSHCRGCTVLGADVQDLPGADRWARSLLREFRRAGVRVPRLWGLHGYTDSNRFVPARASTIGALLRVLPGRIWLTETGGIYRFRPQRSRRRFHPDPRRQARAMEAVFAQATRYRRRIERVYVYHWFAASASNRWDSGVLAADGRPRPAYAVLERHAARFR